ncbi:MAG: hypothetical protein AAB456_00250 [Patescibacteria group bacterium]
MSKQRLINTRFWDDNYTANLDPIEKLLFLYFLTNTSTNICGIYEIPVKKMATETGIDKEMVLKILERLKKDGKVFYHNGWIGLKNFLKHQNQNSPTVKKGIEREIMALPKDILNKMIGYGYPMDTLSHLNLNLNLNPNLTLTKLKPNLLGPLSGKKPLKFNPLGEEILKSFEGVDPKNKTYYGNKTQRSACDFLLVEYGLDRVLQVIAVLPQINQRKLYVRQITSPFELKENWVKVGNALKQENQDYKVAFV